MIFKRLKKVVLWTCYLFPSEIMLTFIHWEKYKPHRRKAIFSSFREWFNKNFYSEIIENYSYAVGVKKKQPWILHKCSQDHFPLLCVLNMTPSEASVCQTPPCNSTLPLTSTGVILQGEKQPWQIPETQGPRRPCLGNVDIFMMWMHCSGWGRVFQGSLSSLSRTGQCTEPLKQRPGGISLQTGVFFWHRVL